MIDKSKLDITFKQKHGSCVLASYAIVSNYFTGISITQFFEDYCKHFEEVFYSWQEAESKYAMHFDNEWRKRNCMGYQVILDLHRNSSQTAFAQSRVCFSGQFFLDSSGVVYDLEHQLRNTESFLNITYEPGRNYHSITVFYDGTQFLARDTNKANLLNIPTLAHIGKLRDSVIYNKI